MSAFDSRRLPGGASCADASERGHGVCARGRGRVRVGAGALSAAALSLALLGSSGDATAQTFGAERYRQPGESRQDFAFELRAGTWLPNVANRDFNPAMPDLGRASAFDRIFRWSNADGGPLLALGGEVDWQILRLGPVGSLGVGLQGYVGWVNARAPLAASTQTSDDPSTWTRTDLRTSLTVVPVTGLAVLRFDGLARAVRYLPFVPYAKFGLGYAFWWVNKGDAYAQYPVTNGTTTTQADVVGGSVGWTGALGLQLMLDSFEPTLARQFDTTMGVNHSYLFVEGYLSSFGFGDPARLDVGTFTWAAGIMLEY